MLQEPKKPPLHEKGTGSFLDILSDTGGLMFFIWLGDWIK